MRDAEKKQRMRTTVELGRVFFSPVLIIKLLSYSATMMKFLSLAFLGVS